MKTALKKSPLLGTNIDNNNQPIKDMYVICTKDP